MMVTLKSRLAYISTNLEWSLVALAAVLTAQIDHYHLRIFLGLVIVAWFLGMQARYVPLITSIRRRGVFNTEKDAAIVGASYIEEGLNFIQMASEEDQALLKDYLKRQLDK